MAAVKTVLLSILLTVPTLLSAQMVSIDYILAGEITKTDRVDVGGLAFFQRSLSMGFDDAGIDNPELIKLLKSKAIYGVDLVYSSYKDSKSFSQVALNRKRLEALKAAMPNLFENTAIEWRLIEQVQDRNKPQAQALFHGFIFHFREAAFRSASGGIVPMRTSSEADAMHSWLGDTLPSNYVSNLPIPLIAVCDTVLDTISQRKPRTYYTGKYLPRLKYKRKKGVRFDAAGFWKRREEKAVAYDTLLIPKTIVECGGKLFTTGFDYRMGTWDPWTTSSFRDSVVSATFNRHREWKNVIVVEDVTGSMYPYTTQTILWRKLNDAVTKINNFAFFNDGDFRPDGPIGNSGGVYPVESEDIEIIEAAAGMAMSKGGGGNLPENNLEAILKGVAKSKVKPDRVIMIADNLAPIRDKSLMKRVLDLQLPVDVILCGSFSGYYNIDYIQLARLTGGTLFTIEQEITGLAELAEGKEIKIGKQKFTLKSGKLVLTR